MKTNAHAPIRRLACLPVLAAAASLAACYVVPVDPRTGVCLFSNDAKYQMHFGA